MCKGWKWNQSINQHKTIIVYFLYVFLCFTPYFCLYLSLTFADFVLHEAYHVTYQSNIKITIVYIFISTTHFQRLNLFQIFVSEFPHIFSIKTHCKKRNQCTDNFYQQYIFFLYHFTFRWETSHAVTSRPSYQCFQTRLAVKWDTTLNQSENYIVIGGDIKWFCCLK